MSKILTNSTAGTIFINDTGVSILANASYTLPEQDYLLWAASSDVVGYIGSASLIVSDGSFSLSISDGIDLIKGAFPKILKAIPYGLISTAYNEITAIASGINSNILSYTASNNIRVVGANVAGSNIATYTIELNGTIIDKAYTNFGSNLNVEFSFSTGIGLQTGDNLTIKAVHSRPYFGDFNARITLEGL